MKTRVNERLSPSGRRCRSCLLGSIFSIPLHRGERVMAGSNGNVLGGFPLFEGEQKGLVIVDAFT